VHCFRFAVFGPREFPNGWPTWPLGPAKRGSFREAGANGGFGQKGVNGVNLDAVERANLPHRSLESRSLSVGHRLNQGSRGKGRISGPANVQGDRGGFMPNQGWENWQPVPGFFWPAGARWHRLSRQLPLGSQVPVIHRNCCSQVLLLLRHLTPVNRDGGGGKTFYVGPI